MNVMLIRLKNNSFYLRLVEWGKLVTLTGFTQLVVQFLGVVSGILIIRLLSTTQYGLYTIANTMLGTMTVLSDSGISNGVLAQGGKVWQHRDKLGTVLNTGLVLRKKLSLFSLLVAVPILSYLLYTQKAEPVTILLIIISLVPAFFSTLSGSLLQLGLTLHQDIKSFQKNQVYINALRLCLSVVMVFVFPYAFVAILAYSVPQLWGNFRLRKLTRPYVDWQAQEDGEVRKDIIKVVKRVFPGALFYCFSGQITVWLLSIFSSTHAVAQAGALGRFAMLLTVFTATFNTLVIPRFARLPEKRTVLYRNFLLIELLLLLLGVCTLLLAWLFPTQILWILGDKYQGLHYELLLVMAVGCLSLISGISFGLSTSRAWVISPFVSISITVATMIAGIYFMDFSTLQGVLKFNLLLMSVEVCMYLGYLLFKIRNVPAL